MLHCLVQTLSVSYSDCCSLQLHPLDLRIDANNAVLSGAERMGLNHIVLLCYRAEGATQPEPKAQTNAAAETDAGELQYKAAGRRKPGKGRAAAVTFDNDEEAGSPG